MPTHTHSTHARARTHTRTHTHTATRPWIVWPNWIDTLFWKAFIIWDVYLPCLMLTGKNEHYEVRLTEPARHVSLFHFSGSCTGICGSHLFVLSTCYCCLLFQLCHPIRLIHEFSKMRQRLQPNLHVIVTYAAIAILWTNRRHLKLWHKIQSFHRLHGLGTDQRSFGTRKNQQTTIIMILSFIAYSIFKNKGIELTTNKKHQQSHARCDMCRDCLVTVSIWRIRE